MRGELRYELWVREGKNVKCIATGELESLKQQAKDLHDERN